MDTWRRGHHDTARLCWHLAPRLLVSDGCLVPDRQQNVNEFHEFGQKKRCWPGAVLLRQSGGRPLGRNSFSFIGWRWVEPGGGGEAVTRGPGARAARGQDHRSHAALARAGNTIVSVPVSLPLTCDPLRAVHCCCPAGGADTLKRNPVSRVQGVQGVAGSSPG